MDLRLTLAIALGKVAILIIKLFGGGATTAPGLFALYLDPNLVKKLSEQLTHGSVLISGTNGKTTTARLIAHALSEKFKIIHNRAGSNLLRGIATTLLSESSTLGKLNHQLGIWEVDEATVGEAVANLRPKIVVFLNLMRDQLDRYGEVDIIRQKWQRAIKQLPKETTLILNADDPGIAYLGKSFKRKISYFGVNDHQINLPRVESVADVRHCLNCQTTLRYSTVLSSHLGHYSCPNCSLKRPSPQISANILKFHSDFSTSFKLNADRRKLNFSYRLPGLYNIYNVLAAAAVCSLLKVDLATVKQRTKDFTAAFGRFQFAKIDHKSALIFLIKNPAGSNEVLRTISLKDNLSLLVILNDRIADGRDISWIWDTNWEILSSKVKRISVSGIRAWDQAVRLKYAGFKLSKYNIYKEVNYSIQKSLQKLNKKDTLLILPTYTALLDVQKSLRKIGAISKWHDQ